MTKEEMEGLRLLLICAQRRKQHVGRGNRRPSYARVQRSHHSHNKHNTDQQNGVAE